MGRRGFCVLAIVFVLCLASVSASHNPDVSVDIAQIYETNTANFTLAVENGLFSLSSINDVTIDIEGFTILSTSDLVDWVKNITGNNINYFTITSAISNWGLQRFGIEAEADKVDENTTAEWTITTVDYSADTETSTVSILIINDDTGPELLNISPEDGSFVKEGTEDFPVSVNASDPETGVNNIVFNWNECGGNETNSIALTENENIYSAVINLSNYNDSTEICFEFVAENNGGENTTYSGILTVDGFAPEIELIAPDDGEIMNSDALFVFNATDNLAPTLNCDMLVDGNIEASVTANNGELTNISVQNISEGEHNWSVSCEDLAGWIGESETRIYILDRTPPNVTLNSPENGAIIAPGTLIDISITDNYALGESSYELIINGSNEGPYPVNDSILINTSDWPEGIQMIIVTANDSVGNDVIEAFEFIIDTTAPEITLIAPANESDVHVNFTFTVMDNYDPMLDCSVYIDDSLSATEEVPNGTNAIEVMLDPGEYNWRIECIDDALNNGVSETWNLTVIDTSGPDITIADINMTIRGNDISINAVVTDISGVSEVSARIIDSEGNIENPSLTQDGDDFSATYTTTVNSPAGEYIIEFTALDAVNNSNTETNTFELTYLYDVDMDLVPSTTSVGSEVMLTGTVLYDNGSTIPEEEIELILPGENTTADVEADGSFAYNFNAPDSDGSYEIIAQITAGNGLTFSDTETLTVEDAGRRERDKSSGGGSQDEKPVETGCGDGVCRSYESYESCPEDCSPEEEFTEQYQCVDDSDCGAGRECKNNRCVVEEPSKKDKGSSGLLENRTKDNLGVGKATSFFDFSKLSSKILWVLILLAAILLILYFSGWDAPKLNLKKRKDKLNLGSYIKKRRR